MGIAPYWGTLGQGGICKSMSLIYGKTEADETYCFVLNTLQVAIMLQEHERTNTLLL